MAAERVGVVFERVHAKKARRRDFGASTVRAEGAHMFLVDFLDDSGQ